MTTTWFRVQPANRDATALLEAGQNSRTWDNDTRFEQTGVSVCASLEDLAWYLGNDGQGIPVDMDFGTWVIVELTGDLLGAGQDRTESLIQPTAVVSVTPIDDEFRAMVDAFYTDLGDRRLDEPDDDER